MFLLDVMLLGTTVWFKCNTLLTTSKTVLWLPLLFLDLIVVILRFEISKDQEMPIARGNRVNKHSDHLSGM